jgi:hypothetical protein
MPKPVILMCTSILALVGVSLWGFFIHPDHAPKWTFVALSMPAIWAFVELAQPGIRTRERTAILRRHRLTLGWAGLLMASMVASRLALADGLAGQGWASILIRAHALVFGASVMVWGNYLPKLLSPWNFDEQPFDWVRVHRFAGWIALLGGLILEFVWLTQPGHEARLATFVLTSLMMVLILGRKLLSLASAPYDPPSYESERG